MLKKFGLGSVIVGVISFIFGILMLNTSGNYWRYSSGMRTIMEFAPWFFIMLGVFGLIGGIFYLTQEMKPMMKGQARVIEKNGQSVVFEFENGIRKTLTVIGNIPLVVGDEGIVGYKGAFVVEFKKQV